MLSVVAKINWMLISLLELVVTGNVKSWLINHGSECLKYSFSLAGQNMWLKFLEHYVIF